MPNRTAVHTREGVPTNTDKNTPTHNSYSLGRGRASVSEQLFRVRGVIAACQLACHLLATAGSRFFINNFDKNRNGAVTINPNTFRRGVALFSFDERFVGVARIAPPPDFSTRWKQSFLFFGEFLGDALRTPCMCTFLVRIPPCRIRLNSSPLQVCFTCRHALCEQPQIIEATARDHPFENNYFIWPTRTRATRYHPFGNFNLASARPREFLQKKRGGG